MHIFYQPDLRTGELTLNEEESKHCVKVLRMKPGEQIMLMNGKGDSATATIIHDHPKKCTVEVSGIIHHAMKSRAYVHLAVAPTKNIERIEWLVEKAVEIGVDEISFVVCENSERSKVNMERITRIAISAIKQSRQWVIPLVRDCVSFEDFITPGETYTHKLIGWCNPEGSAPFTTALSTATDGPRKLMYLIGPEGDFSKREIDMALASGFIPVSFGENRLRTETAALFAVAASRTLL